MATARTFSDAGMHTAPGASSEKMQDQIKENPLESLEVDALDSFVQDLYVREFKDKESVTEQELIKGARLAKNNYANHSIPGEDSVPVHGKPFTPSINTITDTLGPHEWGALKIQQSRKFWQEPKPLLVTLSVCCLAPWVQGWTQAANGNMGWPSEFRVFPNIHNQVGHNVWTFGLVNSILWFAAMLGPAMFDPLCNAPKFAIGRRGSVFCAAILSIVGSVFASYSKNWHELLGARIILGVAFGAKAAIIPVWESEILPPAKRGRVLVSWQVFVSVGLLTGNGATMYFRKAADQIQWRYQVLSGALPAIILLVLVYIGCESPRWLIVRGNYTGAFETLVHLRKERLLAAEEFCYTYFQIQAERAAARGEKEPDFGHYQKRIGYWKRLKHLVTLVRNRRALFATLIVMMTQHLSGINIFAILGTNFYTASKLDSNKSDDQRDWKNLQLNMAFAGVTVVASSLAYFLVEPLPVDSSLNTLDTLAPGASSPRTEKGIEKQKKRLADLQRQLSGRKRLLLFSLCGGTCMLGALTGVLSIPDQNSQRSDGVVAIVCLLAFFYSPGAGAVPFLYSAEVWPNEARDLGMSVGVFVNFLGAGLLTLIAPFGLLWSPVKFFGIFTGLSAFGVILVYFFVPCTDKAVSLEEMSAIFDDPLHYHARNQAKRAFPFKLERKVKEPTQVMYPRPMVQHPQFSYLGPPMEHQPYHSSSPTQYAPYGPPQHQGSYDIPFNTQSYGNSSDSGRFSPYGSQPLNHQQYMYDSPVLPHGHHNSSSPHQSLPYLSEQERSR